MKRIAILGSTGSIGRSAPEVVRHLGDGFRVEALVAHRRGAELAEQVRAFRPRVAALTDPAAAAELRRTLGPCDTEILEGPGAIAAAAGLDGVDVVLAGIVGAAGLPGSVEAVRKGRTLALANKEALVMTGPILMREAKARGVPILPVDSEHSAVFQSMQAGRAGEVRRIILTASGGPFRDRPRGTFDRITVEEALKHPTWRMGAKITIDSATLMNKALEVIEARWLFDLRPEQIEVVIHPQSVVHSMVEFRDGSVVAQLGLPDMKIPIQYALTYPERRDGIAPRMDFREAWRLDFEAPDVDKFPCLRLGFEAARTGGTMGAVLNAANEVAVEKFLAGRARFVDIPAVVEAVMRRHRVVPEPSLEDVLAADAWARAEAESAV